MPEALCPHRTRSRAHTITWGRLLQEDEVAKFQERLAAAKFDFNDFLEQFQRLNNMGGLKMLKLMPGFNQVSEKQLYEVEKKFKMYSGLIASMTLEVGRVCLFGGWGGAWPWPIVRAVSLWGTKCNLAFTNQLRSH